MSSTCFLADQRPQNEASRIFFPTTGIGTKGQAMLLAIDDVSLPLKHNLCYTITKPALHPEPVLTPSRDDPEAVDYIGAQFYGAVLHEQGKFRMWYYPQHLGANPDMSPEQKELTKSWKYGVWVGPVAYAESDDGIHWTKPNLGQLLFKGNRDNNGLDVPDALIEGVHVIRDDDDPDPDRRYKMICNVLPQAVPTIRTATSPDGIRWTAGPQSCIGGDFLEEASFYRFNGLYFVNGQICYVPMGTDGRMIGRSGFVRVSTDFDHWLPESAASFLLPDPADAGKTVEHLRRDEAHLGVGAAPFGNVLVGLYCPWHNDEDDFGKISGDFGLVVSNDGFAFREPIKGYVWLGADESPVTPVPGKNYPTVLCQGNGILNVGDKTLIYYGRWRNIGRFKPGADLAWEDHYCETCLATLPRDRWGALRLVPGAEGGTVLSAPVRLPKNGCDMALNADGAEGMRVEVTGERFQPIPGLNGDGSGTVAGAGGLDLPVTWPGNGLERLGGKTVRFRVHLRKTADTDPRLYAVYLRPSDT